MQLNKEYLVLAGFLGMFLLYYVFGWLFDKKFRTVMSKSKLSSFKKILFHFKGSKMKEDKGHSNACIRSETVSLVNLVLGALCFFAVKITGQTLVFLASAALMAMSFAGFVFLVYINIVKYTTRTRQAQLMDETGFEDYHAARQVQPPKQASYPNARSKSESITGEVTDSMESGREYLKNRGLLDDDVFSPVVADAMDKYVGNEIKLDFAKESDIAKGKEALRDFAGKQLNTEAYGSVNNFEKAVNSYSAEEKSEKTVQDIISEHKQEINPENQFKAVNSYTPVRKDDNQ